MSHLEPGAGGGPGPSLWTLAAALVALATVSFASANRVGGEVGRLERVERLSFLLEARAYEQETLDSPASSSGAPDEATARRAAGAAQGRSKAGALAVVVAATLLSLALLWRVERARSRLRAAEARAWEERGRLANKILSVAERQRSGMAAEVQSRRRIMATLRPPVLEERGLVSALSDYVEMVRQQAGISCTLAARLPDRLPEDTEIVLYRVAQEALTNVARHAGRPAPGSS